MLKRWQYFSWHSMSGNLWTFVCKFKLGCDPDSREMTCRVAWIPCCQPLGPGCAYLSSGAASWTASEHLGLNCSMCLTMCCSVISETSWSGTLSEHAETPFYLEEQVMGNIDLLKDIHCLFSLIPVSPFKVKMTWQDKVMAWRAGKAVWGLWGHLFYRPGINSLHMCCCTKICLYSMCRFRRNVQQAEEMHLSSAGWDSSPAELT